MFPVPGHGVLPAPRLLPGAAGSRLPASRQRGHLRPQGGDLPLVGRVGEPAPDHGVQLLPLLRVDQVGERRDDEGGGDDEKPRDPLDDDHDVDVLLRVQFVRDLDYCGALGWILSEHFLKRGLAYTALEQVTKSEAKLQVQGFHVLARLTIIATSLPQTKASCLSIQQSLGEEESHRMSINHI